MGNDNRAEVEKMQMRHRLVENENLVGVDGILGNDFLYEMTIGDGNVENRAQTELRNRLDDCSPDRS